MSSDAKKPFADPLVRQVMFPDAAEVFGFAPLPLIEALKDGIVAVDTNVLLVPYTTGRASLEQIRHTYQQLTSQNRLRIPGQVAREFAEHRAEKLKALFQQLSRKRDSTNLSRSEYPLLEGVSAYAEMVKCEEQVAKALNEYRKSVSGVLDLVAEWHWDDPVSQIYRDLFKPSVVSEPAFDREELLANLKYRQEHRIPPGYKDSTNDHSGIGDLLIWRALLKIGEEEKRHLVFVSGDEKADWRYQSESQALYPRYELVDEYRRSSKGKSLLIISFAQLLEQFGAPALVVARVKQEETAASLQATSSHRGTVDPTVVEQAVLRWLSAQYPSARVEFNQGFADIFPDITVTTGDHVEGFEIKYLRSPREISRRIREAALAIRSLAASHKIPITLVLVLGQVDGVDPEAMLRTLPQRTLSSSVTAVVMGTLTDDRQFEAWWRVDFPAGTVDGRFSPYIG